MRTRLGLPGWGGLVAAAMLLSVGVGTGAATADPGAAHSNNGRHLGQSPSATPAPHGATVKQQKKQAKPAAKPAKAAKPAGKSAGQRADHQAAAKIKHAATPQATAGDPPGNNGTVKIARVGDLDRIPNNTPHPGCSFEVQWYGFDGGADVVSAVSFTPQAPTGDVSIAVDGPTSVPVGEDAASGAGTATGLDAVATYQLSFTGGAPAKQGYHVRLTVATPRSLGNDTKTKVFWVEPCAGTAAAAPAAAAAVPAAVPAVPAAVPAVPAATPATPGATPAAIVGPPPRPLVPSLSATPMAVVGAPASDRAAARAPGVPTAIEAGQRHSLISRVATSPWAMGLIALGALCAVGGLLLGARRRA
jgi:hypothetical protein